LDVGFIGATITITLNYSAIDDFHALQITTAYDQSFPDFSVFTSRFPAMTSNSGDSSASVLTPFSAGHRLPTELSSESESELLYDWRFTVNQFVLATSLLRPKSSIVFN
jgi:hypothetical protein